MAPACALPSLTTSTSGTFPPRVSIYPPPRFLGNFSAEGFSGILGRGFPGNFSAEGFSSRHLHLRVRRSASLRRAAKRPGILLVRLVPPAWIRALASRAERMVRAAAVAASAMSGTPDRSASQSIYVLEWNAAFTGVATMLAAVPVVWATVVVSARSLIHVLESIAETLDAAGTAPASAGNLPYRGFRPHHHHNSEQPPPRGYFTSWQSDCRPCAGSDHSSADHNFASTLGSDWVYL